MRYSYLDALKIRNVKVERNRFWDIILKKGILNWIIIRNARVISWENQFVDDFVLMALATGCPYLQSLNIKYCDKITDEGINAVLTTGLHQLQSLNMRGCFIVLLTKESKHWRLDATNYNPWI